MSLADLMSAVPSGVRNVAVLRVIAERVARKFVRVESVRAAAHWGVDVLQMITSTPVINLNDPSAANLTHEQFGKLVRELVINHEIVIVTTVPPVVPSNAQPAPPRADPGAVGILQLAENPQSDRATGTPKRRQVLSKAEREKLIGGAIKKRVAPAGRNANKRHALAATISLRDIEADTGIPKSTVDGSDVWRAFHIERSKRAATKSAPKTHRRLTPKMLATCPDPAARSPLDEVADQEDLQTTYRSSCSPEELAQFEAMTPAERTELMDLLADQQSDSD